MFYHVYFTYIFTMYTNVSCTCMPSVFEPRQFQSASNGQLKERKKKPKSFQESIQDIQE